MFSQSVEFYDLIYEGLKDYRAEARTIASIARTFSPEATSLLDVGCGTGEHARALATEFGFRADGIDLEPGFVERARGKNPHGEFLVADMRDFDLHRQYDVITCLFSAIGYARTLEGLDRTLACFRRHLNPGGVIIVEPWFTPDQWRPGYVSQQLVERDGLMVCRMSHASVRDRISVLQFHYLVGTRQGVEYRREEHELGLFTFEEMLQAFERASLSVQHESEGLMGRGLYVATEKNAAGGPDRP